MLTWLNLIKYGAPIALFLAMCWFLHHMGYKAGLERGKELEQKALLTLETELNNRCVKQQKLTGEISNAYQNNLSGVDEQLDNIRMQSRNEISNIIPISRTTSRPDAGTESGKQDKSDAIPAIKLIEFSGTCEKDRLKILGLQDFIRKERAP